MAVNGQQLYTSFGDLDQGALLSLQMKIKEAGFSGTVSYKVSVQPNAWVSIGGVTTVNNTGSTMDFVGTVPASEEDEDFFIYIGNNGDATAFAGYIENVVFTPNFTIWEENWDGLLEPIDYGDEDGYDGGMVTEDDSWYLYYLPWTSYNPRLDGIVLDVADGQFSVDLSRPAGYVGRGILVEASTLFTDQSTDTILTIGAELITPPPGFGTGAMEETGYYGVWVVGAGWDPDDWEADPPPILYLDLTDEGFSAVHSPMLPPSDWNLVEDYTYLVLGGGTHEVDLSQFDEYLGGGISAILVEAYIHPLIG